MLRSNRAGARALKPIPYILAAFLVALVAYLVADFLEMQKYRPTSVGESIDEVLARHSNSTITRVEVAGESAYVVDVGRRSDFFFPSGNVLYLFDSQGRLVEWTIDAGETTPPKLRVAMEVSHSRSTQGAPQSSRVSR